MLGQSSKYTSLVLKRYESMYRDDSCYILTPYRSSVRPDLFKLDAAIECQRPLNLNLEFFRKSSRGLN